MLLTMEHACDEEYQLFPNPERIDKVDVIVLSQAGIGNIGNFNIIVVRLSSVVFHILCLDVRTKCFLLYSLIS